MGRRQVELWKKPRAQSSERKHPAALAWDQWIDSDAGKSFADIVTLRAPADQRQYLENRLWHAFMAGYRAGDQPT